MNRFVSSVERVQRISSAPRPLALCKHNTENATENADRHDVAPCSKRVRRCGRCVVSDTQEETAWGISLQRGQKQLVQ